MIWCQTLKGFISVIYLTGKYFPFHLILFIIMLWFQPHVKTKFIAMCLGYFMPTPTCLILEFYFPIWYHQLIIMKRTKVFETFCEMPGHFSHFLLCFPYTHEWYILLLLKENLKCKPNFEQNCKHFSSRYSKACNYARISSYTNTHNLY